MSGSYAIRCPVCLREMSVSKSTPVHESLHCDRCKSSFEFQNALPGLKKDITPPLSNTTIVESFDRQRNLFIILSIPLVIAFLSKAVSYTNTLDGPGFLFFLVMVFLATFIASFLIRALWIDLDAVRVVAFLVFELLCIYRLVWGYNHDMHKFAFLIVSMVIGGYLYFARWDNNRSNGSGCGGSGCGGSGCGGGGCGGCGG